MITPEEIENLHSGHVLLRDEVKKIKLRVVKPSYLNTCEVCFTGIEGNSVKWERGGNITLSVFCPSCACEEINK